VVAAASTNCSRETYPTFLLAFTAKSIFQAAHQIEIWIAKLRHPEPGHRFVESHF
jgi:hypothetical protein